MAGNRVLGPIEPEPPQGIKYIIGGESWLPPERQNPVRLVVEEWRNLGPMVIRPDVTEVTPGGFNCRVTEFTAPPGAKGFCRVNGRLHWCERDVYGNAPDWKPDYTQTG